MPAKGHCVPAGQTTHEVDAEFLAYWPAEHAMQTVDPGTDVNDPDSQGVSTLDADEFVNCAKNPAGAGIQCLFELEKHPPGQECLSH